MSKTLRVRWTGGDGNTNFGRYDQIDTEVKDGFIHVLRFNSEGDQDGHLLLNPSKVMYVDLMDDPEEED